MSRSAERGDKRNQSRRRPRSRWHHRDSFRVCNQGIVRIRAVTRCAEVMQHLFRTSVLRFG